MAYSSGTVQDQDEILDVIKNAAVAAGWSVNDHSADGEGFRLHLTKASQYANLRSLTGNESGYGPEVQIKGSTGYDAGQSWSSQPGAHGGRVNMGAAYVSPGQRGNPYSLLQFPASYRLFSFANPDTIIFVTEYEPARYQWVAFGSIAKYGSWTGGQFVAASNGGKKGIFGNFDKSAGFSIGGQSNARSYAPFYRMNAGFYAGTGTEVSNFALQAEVEGWNWLFAGTYTDGDTQFEEYCSANEWSSPVNSRSPNTLNEAAILTPFWVFTPKVDHIACLGVAEHIRQMPIDNFSPAQILTIGSDRWMVFPYFEKNGYTGRFGWAIEYDGP